MLNCEWLPELEIQNENEGWENYLEKLREIFFQDFINTNPLFDGKRVALYNKEESFWHITTQDYDKNSNRQPDEERCKRIKWIRKFIENFDCNKIECADYCKGMKVWIEYGKRNRIFILLEEVKFVVILEERTDRFYLITAYYIDQEHTLKKLNQKYERYKKQKAAPQNRPAF